MIKLSSKNGFYKPLVKLTITVFLIIHSFSFFLLSFTLCVSHQSTVWRNNSAVEFDSPGVVEFRSAVEFGSLCVVEFDSVLLDVAESTPRSCFLQYSELFLSIYSQAANFSIVCHIFGWSVNLW